MQPYNVVKTVRANTPNSCSQTRRAILMLPEFRITALARILCKFLKNLYITISYSCHFNIELEFFELKICLLIYVR